MGSSDDSIATVSSDGIVTGLSEGVVTIKAKGVNSDRSIVEDSTNITITDVVVTSLVVTPESTSTPIGLSQSLTATAYFSDGSARNVTEEPALSWSSDDPSVATVSTGLSSDNGVATGVSSGTTNITATGMVNGQTFTDSTVLTVTDAIITALTVSPQSLNMPVNTASELFATATYSDGTSSDVSNLVTWDNSNTNVATISSTGLVTALNVGITNISAFANGEHSNTVDVAVCADLGGNVLISLILVAVNCLPAHHLSLTSIVLVEAPQMVPLQKLPTLLVISIHSIGLMQILYVLLIVHRASLVEITGAYHQLKSYKRSW